MLCKSNTKWHVIRVSGSFIMYLSSAEYMCVKVNPRGRTNKIVSSSWQKFFLSLQTCYVSCLVLDYICCVENIAAMGELCVSKLVGCEPLAAGS